MNIAWTPDLNTGIDVIDGQHQRIVDYINQLGQAIHSQDKHAIGTVLDELVDYTVSHFTFEESLLDEANYRMAVPHKAVHEMFIKRVARYQERHAGGEDVARSLYSMLGTWLIHHIKRDDRAYVADVRAKLSTSMAQVIETRKQTGWLGRSLAKLFG